MFNFNNFLEKVFTLLCFGVYERNVISIRFLFMQKLIEKKKVFNFGYFDNIQNPIFQKSLFENNNCLEKIIIPKKMTKFSDSCFFSCKNLKCIQGLEQITIFENLCLYNSPVNLNNINWKKVYKLGTCPFGENKTLINNLYFNFKADKHAFDSLNIENLFIGNDIEFGEEIFFKVNVSNILFEKEIRVLKSGIFFASGIKKIKIPNSIEKIEEDCFSCSDLEEVDLSDSIISEIPKNCFYGCSFLKEINLSKTIKRIHREAFSATRIRLNNEIFQNVEMFE